MKRIDTVSAGDKNECKYFEVPIWRRYSLSISEAAKLFGIGEKRLYSMVIENRGADFILEVGTHVRIKRELFSRFLDKVSSV